LNTENGQASEENLNLEQDADWNFLIQQIKAEE
jgi:hypothetical protein